MRKHALEFLTRVLGLWWFKDFPAISKSSKSLKQLLNFFHSKQKESRIWFIIQKCCHVKSIRLERKIQKISTSTRFSWTIRVCECVLIFLMSLQWTEAICNSWIIAKRSYRIVCTNVISAVSFDDVNTHEFLFFSSLSIHKLIRSYCVQVCRCMMYNHFRWCSFGTNTTYFRYFLLGINVLSSTWCIQIVPLLWKWQICEAKRPKWIEYSEISICVHTTHPDQTKENERPNIVRNDNINRGRRNTQTTLNI